MKLQSYWWVSVPVLLVGVVAVALWTQRPASLSKPSTPAQPAAASTPRQEPDTLQAAAMAGVAKEEQSERSLMDCMSDLPRFLAGVPELAVQGIVLSMGAASGDASVSFKWPCGDFPLPQVIALTPDGAEPLSGDETRAESTVDWACGGASPAVALTAPRPVEKGDLPIALGAQAGKVLQWIPAKPIDGAADCAPPRPGFARQEQQLFELPGREGRWSLEFWKHTGSPAESREAFPISLILRLSRVAADGTCSLSAMTQHDSEGHSRTRKAPLSKALGLLSLQGEDPSAKAMTERSWMIFESPGYEGRGVSAIPLAADGVTLMHEAAEGADWLIYSGC